MVALTTDDNPLSWATPEVQELCHLRTRLFVNIAQVAKLRWNDEAGPSNDMLDSLIGSLEPLLRMLYDLGIQPSLTTGREHFTSHVAVAHQLSRARRLKDKFERPPTMWVQPTCPGLQVQLRPSPNMTDTPCGAVRSEQQIEVYEELVQGYYQLADGSVRHSLSVCLTDCLTCVEVYFI
jgi:hypothetical protein